MLLVARNKQLVAGNKQLVAGNKQLFARNMLLVRPRNLLPRNMLRWCKRGFRDITSMRFINLRFTYLLTR